MLVRRTSRRADFCTPLQVVECEVGADQQGPREAGGGARQELEHFVEVLRLIADDGDDLHRAADQRTGVELGGQPGEMLPIET